MEFPISRDPPEGGTSKLFLKSLQKLNCFQFLGIPPKGELKDTTGYSGLSRSFQFLGIPPKGEHATAIWEVFNLPWTFPISRNPPEGGTVVGD